MRTVIVTQAARTEMIRAQDWYENEVNGLGLSFIAEVNAMVRRITVTPEQFPVIYKDVRRALLRRFPYALMFVIEDDGGLTVIACFHGSRAPINWLARR